MRRVAADNQAIAAAASEIQQGGLVAFPTETVYGLGADATNGRAVAAVFAAKIRPRFNPLIVHVPNASVAMSHANWTPEAAALAQAFWPGPLTLVLPRLAHTPIAELVSAGLPTLAFRSPSHPVARALIEAAGVPIAAPSANRSGHVSATTAAHVAQDLGGAVHLILDAGPCALGIESTVVGLAGERPTLLRSGAISRAEIERVLGRALTRGPAEGHPEAPGGLPSHYAPRAALRLNATDPSPGEAFLGFGPAASAAGALTLNLSPAGDLLEAAANLFAHLRALDASGVTVIAVAPVPDTGLGEAINDRLRRAAAPRPTFSPGGTIAP